MQTSATVKFTKSLPMLKRFQQALPRENYRQIPDDWFVAVTDVVQSRLAIKGGRYKAVNMAGVSMISGIMNVLGHQDVAYFFGGDGAAVVFSPEDYDKVKGSLSAVVGWAEDEMELQLRAAIVPVSEIRNLDHDLLVAAVQVSSAICNFAFLGGGITLAEKLMKEGEFRIQRAPSGVVPDLTGLSCRWKPVEEPGFKIVSLIVEPALENEEIPYDTVAKFMLLARSDADNPSPISQNRLGVAWSLKSARMEAKATGDSVHRIIIITLLAWLLNKTGWSFGTFDPNRYREYLALNTDYRKIQDGIRMTVSLEQDAVVELRKALEEQRASGKLRFGMCVQDKAMLTCFVPSVTSDNHFHFLDGAGGGYAAAADVLS